MTCLTDHIAKQKLLPFLPALICSCFFIAGVSSLLMDSVMGAGGKTWSFAQYQRFWSDPLYFDYLVRSIRVALYATLGTVVIGYAMANWMACGSPALRRSILLLLIFQFFTVTITKVYAILLVLGNNGLINRSLMALGILQKPLPLVNHELGVVIGLTASALPLAVLPIFSVLMARPASLDEAASTLGAGRMVIFWHITLPLSLPGVIAGIMLVFLYSLGGMITPSLIGGGFVDMIASFAYEQALLLSNTGFAAAGATVTLFTAFLLVLVLELLYRHLRRDA